jgi:hypothetical protein
MVLEKKLLGWIIALALFAPLVIATPPLANEKPECQKFDGHIEEKLSRDDGYRKLVLLADKLNYANGYRCGYRRAKDDQNFATLLQAQNSSTLNGSPRNIGNSTFMEGLLDLLKDRGVREELLNGLREELLSDRVQSNWIAHDLTLDGLDGQTRYNVEQRLLDSQSSPLVVPMQEGGQLVSPDQGQFEIPGPLRGGGAGMPGGAPLQ